jgi:hypothetical protein
MSDMTITSETTFDRFRIKFDGIIQMSIKRDIESFQSWQVDRTYYAIEIQTKDATILYEYDSKEKWEMIISEMEKHKII